MMAGLLVVLSMTFIQGWPGVAMVNDGLGRVLAPVANVADAFGKQARVLWSAPGNSAVALERLEALERENAELKIDNAKLGEVTRENDRLRELLAFKRARIDLDLRGASVQASTFAREPGSLVHGAWIDAGHAQGVALGDPVASNRGLVGRVTRVLDRSAHVQLILDAESSVGARIERTLATGLLSGSPSGRLLLRYIPQNVSGEDERVQVGDLVYSSGLSGAAHFPPMIPIGQVVEVLQSDERPTQEAVVRPFVTFDELDLVLVITDWRPDPGIGEEPSLEGAVGGSSDG